MRMVGTEGEGQPIFGGAKEEPAAALYPPIELVKDGMFEGGDGNLVYYEVCNNPDGRCLT
jgi:hypothetical protein